MSRYLMVVPPLTGHIMPLTSVAAELTRRGHEVAWAGERSTIRSRAGEDAVVFPCMDAPADDDYRPADLRGFAALRFLWEDVIIPLGDVMVDRVEAAVKDFEPDVLVVDQQALAGAVVARRHGCTWATSCTTSAALESQLTDMPKVEAWLHDLLWQFWRRHGVAQPSRDGGRADGAGWVAAEQLQLSPSMILAFTTEELAGEPKRYGDRVRFVGPSLGPRPPDSDFPWDRLASGRPVVLASIGTVNGTTGGRFLGTCVEAFAALGDRVQPVIADPAGVLDEVAVPPGVVVRPRVPQLELLDRCAAVVSHGGHNTVCETLSRGVPLVVAPIRDDQPIIAQQVVDAGAGIRVRYSHVRAAQLHQAVLALLDEPSYADNARRIADSFAAAGGATAAVANLESLAAGDRR